jgi:NAD(P)-dependent dehydrogenase (short-subunit alcohol dehydrogenase family)
MSMNLELEGKRALITGSTAGIGFAIAEKLAVEGASVIVNGRTQKRVDDALAKLSRQGSRGSIKGLAADLGTADGVRQAIDRFPDIDVLVNNLGIFEPKTLEEISDAEWLRFFEVNVMSGVRLSRHHLPRMKQHDWGRIIFISSESAVQIPAEMIHYGMTKTAQLAVARGMAETTAGTNITVNSVLVGPTASEGVIDFVDQLAAQQKTDRNSVEKEFFQSMRSSSLLKRFIEPKEIGAFVAFLCSPLASAINGAALRADGGVVRSIL